MQYMPRPNYAYYPEQNRYGEGYPMQNYAPPPPGMYKVRYCQSRAENIKRITLITFHHPYINLRKADRKSIPLKTG